MQQNNVSDGPIFLIVAQCRNKNMSFRKTGTSIEFRLVQSQIDGGLVDVPRAFVSKLPSKPTTLDLYLDGNEVSVAIRCTGQSSNTVMLSGLRS